MRRLPISLTAAGGARLAAGTSILASIWQFKESVAAASAPKKSKLDMPPAEIQAVIAANDVIRPVNRGMVSFLHRSNYAANVPICEDTDIIETEMPQADGALFGVFDGHAGHAASYFLRDEIAKWLQHYHSSGRTQNLLHSLPIVEADNAFLQRALDTKQFGDGIAGACYVLAHVRGNQLSVAWGGDCRAVVGRRADQNYECVSMTNDHQIDNANERRRLLTEHPDEPDIIHHSRVKGRLQPTRGFGDGAYKLPGFYYVWVCCSLDRRTSDSCSSRCHKRANIRPGSHLTPQLSQSSLHSIYPTLVLLLKRKLPSLHCNVPLNLPHQNFFHRLS